MKNVPLFSGSADAWKVQPVVGWPCGLPKGVEGRGSGAGAPELGRQGELGRASSSAEDPRAVSLSSPCAVLDLGSDFSLKSGQRSQCHTWVPDPQLFFDSLHWGHLDLTTSASASPNSP